MTQYSKLSKFAKVTIWFWIVILVPTVAFTIESFRGVPRRLELVGNHHGRPVYYDYAHHPTEIIAGINALKPIARDFGE